MADAAERAVAAMRAWSRPYLPTPGEAVAALMADPALLVDLAIEAGGLVQLSDRFGWKPDPNFAGFAIVNVDGEAARDDAWLPLYRRVVDRG